MNLIKCVFINSMINSIGGYCLKFGVTLSSMMISTWDNEKENEFHLQYY